MGAVNIRSPPHASSLASSGCRMHQLSMSLVKQVPTLRLLYLTMAVDPGKSRVIQVRRPAPPTDIMAAGWKISQTPSQCVMVAFSTLGLRI